MTINPWLLGAPLVLATAIIAVLGWRSTMLRRHKQRLASLPLPQGAVAILGPGLAPALLAHLIGGLMLVAVGTYGVNQLLRSLIRFAECGLGRMVGSILVLENDAQLRTQFQQRVPEEFRDGRIVYGHSEEYAGGFANRSVAWAMEHIELWGTPVVAAAEAVIDLHERRNGARAPSDILLFQSLGGQAPVGIPALATIAERFDVPTIAFTALPRHTRLRTRWAELKRAYEAHGCSGWVLADNLGDDPVTADYGMVAIPLALASATLSADRPTRLNNAFALALPREPGAVLIYQVLVENLVGWPFRPDPGAPPREYYTLRGPLAARISNGLRRLRAGTGAWSADVPVGEAGTSIFDIVMTSVGPADLVAVEDAVTAGQKLRGRFLRRNDCGGSGHQPLTAPDIETIYASTATSIDPAKPVCPIVFVRLAAVRRGAQLVDEIVKPPHQRAFLANPVRQAPGNGPGRRPPPGGASFSPNAQSPTSPPRKGGPS